MWDPSAYPIVGTHPKTQLIAFVPNLFIGNLFIITFVSIPQTLTPLKRTADNIKDPLFRFFEREVSV